MSIDINLDNIWEWLGFSQKVNAKRVLEKNFIIEKDYKLLLSQQGKQNNFQGGHNKEIFLLNIETFKKFCLKACTKKADEIHDYFIKLEHIKWKITGRSVSIVIRMDVRISKKYLILI